MDHVVEITVAAINNGLHACDVPDFIQSIKQALSEEPAPPKQEPAVNPKKSVYHDFIICLEDGKRVKMLKRHLRVHFGLTPAQYRAKWGLPDTYPMVAPSYSEERSKIALKTELGKRNG